MCKTRLILLVVLLLFGLFHRFSMAEETAAKLIFGGASTQAPLKAESVGGYAKGCLAGAKALPVDGAYWQVMRLSRNRNWGHPAVIDFLQNFAKAAHDHAGWRGLMIGDISQPRGGPMLTGHRSHQIGLDADIWLYEMPETRLSYKERENLSAISMLKSGTRVLDSNRWSARHHQLVKTAAEFPEIERIFVHPAIKQALCTAEPQSNNRDWLSKIRPWYGHHYHFHIRLRCPKGDKNCKNQAPPKKGDGCGSELNWWLSDAPWTPKPVDKNKPAPKPKPPLTLAGLPPKCKKIALSENGQFDESKIFYGFTPPPKFNAPPRPKTRPIRF